jgi:hypothetical protein
VLLLCGEGAGVTCNLLPGGLGFVSGLPSIHGQVIVFQLVRLFRLNCISCIYHKATRYGLDDPGFAHGGGLSALVQTGPGHSVPGRLPGGKAAAF